MRILLHGYGSRGDVQPTLALALGLSAAGHDVAVAAASDFRAMVEARGIGYEEFGIDLAELSRTEMGRRWLGGTARNPVEDLWLMRGAMAHVAEPVARTLVATTDAYDAVVTTPILLDAMLSLSVPRGRRLAVALLQPAVATAESSSFCFAVRPGRSLANRAVGYFSSMAVRPVISPIGDEVRRQAGLPRLTWRGYYRGSMATPFLLGCSPLVVPPADDWPVDIDVTGYWTLPPEPWTPDPALAAFLDAGPAPVYVGFGSMAAADSAQTSSLLAEAVSRAGVRAVVLRGTADLDVESDAVHVIDGAPHEQLFPLVAAVVGHGGAGTTGAALRAGVPQVVVPHMGDQPYWGRRVHELGVGPAPLPRRGLTAEALADGIRAALDPATAARAADLGARLRAEDGVGNAVARLQHTLLAS